MVKPFDLDKAIADFQSGELQISTPAEPTQQTVADTDNLAQPDFAPTFIENVIEGVKQEPITTATDIGLDVASAVNPVGGAVRRVVQPASVLISTGARTLDDLIMGREITVPEMIKNASMATLERSGVSAATSLLGKASEFVAKHGGKVFGKKLIDQADIDVIESEIRRQGGLVKTPEGYTLRDVEDAFFNGEELFTAVERVDPTFQPLGQTPATSGGALIDRAKLVAGELFPNDPKASKLVVDNFRKQRAFHEALSRDDLNLPFASDALEARYNLMKGVLNKNEDVLIEQVTNSIEAVKNATSKSTLDDVKAGRLSVDGGALVDFLESSEFVSKVGSKSGGKTAERMKNTLRKGMSRGEQIAPEQLTRNFNSLIEDIKDDGAAMRTFVEDVLPQFERAVLTGVGGDKHPAIKQFGDSLVVAARELGDVRSKFASPGFALLREIAESKDKSFADIFRNNEAFKEVVGFLGDSELSASLPMLLREAVVQEATEGGATKVVTARGIKNALNKFSHEVIESVAGEDYLEHMKLAQLGSEVGERTGVGTVGIDMAGKDIGSLEGVLEEAGQAHAMARLSSDIIPQRTQRAGFIRKLFGRMRNENDLGKFSAALLSGNENARALVKELDKGKFTPQTYAMLNVVFRELGLQVPATYRELKEMSEQRATMQDIDASIQQFVGEQDAQNQ